MHPDRSPFPLGWVNVGLPGVGLDHVRPRGGPYGSCDLASLPPLPVALDGSFAWLAAQPARTDWPIGPADDRDDLAARADRLFAAVPDLPQPFAAFLRRPELHQRIRSYSACFLDLSPCAVPAPGSRGQLVRFLSDQQGCFWWYVFLSDDGDHAVVLSQASHGAPEEMVGWHDDDRRSEQPVFVAEDFESFLCRYWLENEIAFCGDDVAALPDAARAYIDLYRRKAH